MNENYAELGQEPTLLRELPRELRIHKTFSWWTDSVYTEKARETHTTVKTQQDWFHRFALHSVYLVRVGDKTKPLLLSLGEKNKELNSVTGLCETEFLARCGVTLNAFYTCLKLFKVTVATGVTLASTELCVRL